MRLSIESDLCQGHARCNQLFPGLFDIDEEGYGVVRCSDVSPQQEDQALRAAATCPERAILIDNEAR